MLRFYKKTMPGEAALPDAGQVWIDLFNPTRDEELRIESYLGVLVPTREDMAEIETSSRLYLEDGAAFMTAQIAYFGGEDRLQSGPITFVLVKKRLVTIRYIDPVSMQIFVDHIEKQPALCATGASTFLNLLDIFIDRTADMIEKTSHTIDELSKAIFAVKRKAKLEDMLISLGGAQNDIAKIRDSLVSLARLTVFAGHLEHETGLNGHDLKEFRERIRIMAQDVTSLSDHTSYVTGNMSFLLDAALGLISVEQNNVMKVISIVSAIFLPLTLIASIYGMNFDYMPLLHVHNAFWWAVGFMMAIAVGLLGYFKYTKWF